MPRSARILPPEGFFHILTRGNNKQDVFHELKDFRKYKSILWEVKKEHAYRLYHYCLMTNHVHLLLETVAGQHIPIPNASRLEIAAIKACRLMASYAI